jgi:hypothetical protein
MNLLTGIQNCKCNGLHQKLYFKIEILVIGPNFVQLLVYMNYVFPDALAAYSLDNANTLQIWAYCMRSNSTSRLAGGVFRGLLYWDVYSFSSNSSLDFKSFFMWMLLWCQNKDSQF